MARLGQRPQEKMQPLTVTPMGLVTWDRTSAGPLGQGAGLSLPDQGAMLQSTLGFPWHTDCWGRAGGC